MYIIFKPSGIGPERILDIAGCHRREGKEMSEIRVKENESLESALRRFKRSCA